MDVVGKERFNKSPHFLELGHSGLPFAFLDSCTDIKGGVGSQQVPIALERVEGSRAPNLLLEDLSLAEMDVRHGRLRQHETIVFILCRAVLHQLLQVHYQLPLLVVLSLETFELPHF